jgi:hypothetical protein
MRLSWRLLQAEEENLKQQAEAEEKEQASAREAAAALAGFTIKTLCSFWTS